MAKKKTSTPKKADSWMIAIHGHPNTARKEYRVVAITPDPDNGPLRLLLADKPTMVVYDPTKHDGKCMVDRPWINSPKKWASYNPDVRKRVEKRVEELEKEIKAKYPYLRKISNPTTSTNGTKAPKVSKGQKAVNTFWETLKPLLAEAGRSNEQIDLLRVNANAAYETKKAEIKYKLKQQVDSNSPKEATTDSDNVTNPKGRDSPSRNFLVYEPFPHLREAPTWSRVRRKAHARFL